MLPGRPISPCRGLQWKEALFVLLTANGTANKPKTIYIVLYYTKWILKFSSHLIPLNILYRRFQQNDKLWKPHIFSVPSLNSALLYLLRYDSTTTGSSSPGRANAGSRITSLSSLTGSRQSSSRLKRPDSARCLLAFSHFCPLFFFFLFIFFLDSSSIELRNFPRTSLFFLGGIV